MNKICLKTVIFLFLLKYSYCYIEKIEMEENDDQGDHILLKRSLRGRVNRENASQLIGVGGRFGALYKSIWKRTLIAIDLCIPYSYYKLSPDGNMTGLDMRNMGAITIRPRSEKEKRDENRRKILRLMKSRMRAGDHFKAVSLSLELYRDDRSGEIYNDLKEGLVMRLQIDVANRLISTSNMHELFERFELRKFKPVPFSELRRDAMLFSQNDITVYRKLMKDLYDKNLKQKSIAI